MASGQARIGPVRGALRRLQLGRAPLIGTVLNKVDSKMGGYGYGFSEQSYTYGLQVQDVKPKRPSLLGSRT